MDFAWYVCPRQLRSLLTHLTERLSRAECHLDWLKAAPADTSIPILDSRRLAELTDCVTWSHTRKPDHARFDQSLRKKNYPDERLLLAFHPVSCHWYKLAHVDEEQQIFGDCGTVYPNADLLQLWWVTLWILQNHISKWLTQRNQDQTPQRTSFRLKYFLLATEPQPTASVLLLVNSELCCPSVSYQA